jgi:hypothetical protein
MRNWLIIIIIIIIITAINNDLIKVVRKLKGEDTCLLGCCAV